MAKLQRVGLLEHSIVGCIEIITIKSNMGKYHFHDITASTFLLFSIFLLLLNLSKTNFRSNFPNTLLRGSQNLQKFTNFAQNSIKMLILNIRLNIFSSAAVLS